MEQEGLQVEEVVAEKGLVVEKEVIEVESQGAEVAKEAETGEDKNNNLKRGEPEEREAGSVMKVQKVAPELPHLAMLRLEGVTAGEVAERLEVWEGGVTNGLVMEVTKHFSDHKVMKSLVSCVARRLGIMEKLIDRSMKGRLRKYFSQTRSKMEAAGGAAEEEWLYLAAIL